MSDIKNEALQNNPRFLAKLKEYGKIYKEVLGKFNTQYIRERLNGFTEEEVARYMDVIRSAANLIIEFSKNGGFEHASGF